MPQLAVRDGGWRPFTLPSGVLGRGRSGGVRDGGWRSFALPVAAGAVVDPTDADTARATALRPLSPEERLRASVLLHALMDVRRYPPTTPDGAAVRAWFASEELRWPYAFVPLCEALGLEPGAVRARAAVCGSQMHQSTESKRGRSVPSTPPHSAQ